jgi:UDP-glucose 4-epimerase
VSPKGVVVVTGGAGFIGSHVVDALLVEGGRVVVLDDLSTGSLDNVAPEVRVDRLDLADATAAEHIARLRPTVVIHCAAQASVSSSFRDPVGDARSNIIGSLNVIQGALDAGTERLIYITTGGALYGHPTSLPCTEDHPVAPLSPYGWSKWIVEEYLRLLAAGKFSWTALRLANVYGPRQRLGGEAGVVAMFADRMRRSAPVVIHGDGEQTRDFVYVGDVAGAVMAAVAGSADGPVNIGTGKGTSILELFRTMASLVGYPFEPQHGEDRHGDIRHSALDGSRALSDLGWRPRTLLVDGLRSTLAEPVA